MTPQAFLEFSKAISEPMLLLDLDGRVIASSHGVRVPWEGDIKGSLLSELVVTKHDVIDRYVRRCAKNSQPVVGALSFRSTSTGQETPCRCEGVGVRSVSTEAPNQVVLRIISRDNTTVSKFAELTRSLHDKNREAAHQWRELEELQRHEAQLRTLIDATQDAVVFIDGDARIIKCNESASSMFGYTREELLGQPVTMLMPKRTADEHDEYIERYERTGERRAIGSIRSVTGRRKNGDEIPIELSVTALGQEHKARYGAFLRDVSERRNLQEELLENERLASVGATAAIFAHEVGNPLNSMSMNAQLAMRRLEASDGVDPRVKRPMGAVLAEIRRLTELLDEFRMLSKRQQFQMSPTKLQDIVHQLVEQEQESYAACGVEFVAKLPADPIWIRVDADKIKQALLNLAKNGAEAIKDKGNLTLRASATSDIVRIEMADSGSGIPADVDVFALFATTKETGSGLGLPIVQQIVAAHGGAIRYESQPNIGTQFIIELPRFDERNAHP